MDGRKWTGGNGPTGRADGKGRREGRNAVPQMELEDWFKRYYIVLNQPNIALICDVAQALI